MHIQPSQYTYSSTMHPPLSTSSNNTTIRLSQEHRTRLYQVINELNDDQLRLFLTNHLQTISNTTLNNQFQHYSHTQLIQQSYILIDNYYSPDLEQTLYAIRQKRFTPDYQQQQQQLYRVQQNYPTSYNQQQQQYYYPQQTAQTNYRYPTQLRPIRPNSNSVQSNQNSRPPQQTSYYPSILPRQQYIRPSPVITNNNTNNNNSSSIPPRYQIPVLPPPPSSAVSRPILPNPSTLSSSSLNIIHKTLPFYHPITCVYECYQVFRYDTYRKQYFSRNEFLLSVDICNQLSLSYDYDADLDIHKTTKCLLLRLARTDQGVPSNGIYDDHLPPNLVITINSQNLTNLPTPKPCTRNQTDLIRIGREVDITSYCMFNPTLNNELTMTWSYRPDNKDLHMQYLNAQFALHIYLVEHLTIDDLCEQIKNKSGRFYRDDLVKLLAKAIAIDRDLGLEVSDQKLKLKCPIDQRRLKIPIRATTCQHLQCFDLINYITLNEKAGKWICPVCNKSALFDDLQIDSYTESILNSISNEDITEITIDSQLNWSPVTSPSSVFIEYQPAKSNMNNIILDNGQREVIDSKFSIPLISSSTNHSNEVIFIDDD